MILYSDQSDIYCHCTRFVLAAKGINVDVQMVEPGKLPEDLIDVNPYRSLPTFVDRDLVLYDARVIMEYLDERFPHPPLMPVDPVSRAKARLVRYRIEQDWYSLVPELESNSEKKASKARKTLSDSLVASSEVFAYKPYFLGDELGMADCYMTPLLWRLAQYDVKLPKEADPIKGYASRLFRTAPFQASLSAVERDMNR